jgi:hypothetical protein
MNIRSALHALAAIAAALAGGTVVFAGLDDVVTKNIASIAGLVAIAINIYMGSTTTGAAK